MANMGEDHAMEDHAMEDAAAPAPQFAQQISGAEYDQQAVEFTTQAVQQLNADVRATPAIGARSTFWKDERNVARGLPVFQGKHTRFVYDEEEEEIVGAVDVTEQALRSGPNARTVAELDADLDSEEEEEEEEYEEEYDESDNVGMENVFYSSEQQEDAGMAVDDAQVSALLEDVEMELSSVAIDEQRLMQNAALKH